LSRNNGKDDENAGGLVFERRGGGSLADDCIKSEKALASWAVMAAARRQMDSFIFRVKNMTRFSVGDAMIFWQRGE